MDVKKEEDLSFSFYHFQALRRRQEAGDIVIIVAYEQTTKLSVNFASTRGSHFLVESHVSSQRDLKNRVTNDDDNECLNRRLRDTKKKLLSQTKQLREKLCHQGKFESFSLNLCLMTLA